MPAVVTVAATAVIWWPFWALASPFWISASAAVAFAVLAAAAVPMRLAAVSIAAGIGTYAGLYFGASIAGTEDPLAGEYIPFIAVVVALAVVTGVALAGAAIRAWVAPGVDARRKLRAAAYGVAGLSVASLALAPGAVELRIERNERVAQERMMALRSAVENSLTAYRIEKLSDSRALRPYYSGPPIHDRNWRQMAGNVVKEDGYWISLRYEDGRQYTIFAKPLRKGVDGRRGFCTDQSAKQGCEMAFEGLRPVCGSCP